MTRQLTKNQQDIITHVTLFPGETISRIIQHINEITGDNDPQQDHLTHQDVYALGGMRLLRMDGAEHVFLAAPPTPPVPQMRKRLTVTNSIDTISMIYYTANYTIAQNFDQFGQNSQPTRDHYELYVDARYDFSEVLTYVKSFETLIPQPIQTQTKPRTPGHAWWYETRFQYVKPTVTAYYQVEGSSPLVVRVFSNNKEADNFINTEAHANVLTREDIRFKQLPAWVKFNPALSHGLGYVWESAE